MSTLIVLALIVLIVLVLPFWLVRYVGGKTGPTDTRELVGVRGWLAFLIVSFGFWGPLVGIAGFFNEFSELENSFPQVLRSAEYRGYKSSILFLVVILCLLQVYFAGLLLIKRENASVQLFKKFLLLAPLVCLVPPALGKIYFPAIELQQGTETLVTFFWMVVINGLWFLYLRKSRRVQATYGMASTTRIPDRSVDAGKYKIHTDSVLFSDERKKFEDTAATLHSESSADTKTKVDSLKRDEFRIDGKRVLIKVLGESNFDEALWTRCMTKSGFDEIRACTEYWRAKSEG